VSVAEREALIVTAAVAAASALPGGWLVVRRQAMTGDAVSHVLLFGVVVGYLVVRDIDSPVVQLGAAGSGLLAVGLVNLLRRTGRVAGDAALGLVFPALFAAGSLLASLYLRNTHLDVDAVLLGHAEFAVATDPITVNGVYLGRRPAVVLTGLTGLSALLTVVFYRPLQLTSFDPELAAGLGFRPGLVQAGLLAVVAVTAVAAFDAVGPVLVVAFLTLPPLTARQLTDRLGRVLAGGVLVGLVGAGLGVRLAFATGTTVAGAVAVTLGGLFAAGLAISAGRPGRLAPRPAPAP
jgi:manganese/zinc/iron transport system permease protein